MAANFPIGTLVKLNVEAPQGTVESIRFNDAGDVEYLFSWMDADGNAQNRWFIESTLAAV
jgi:hypothetical protein